jgi:hypothetical protein
MLGERELEGLAMDCLAGVFSGQAAPPLQLRQILRVYA